MDLAEAERLAVRLMADWGCDGWRLKWDNANRRFGQVQYGPRVLSLSTPLVAANPVVEVVDTIRHEIAHIKAGPWQHHNEV